MTIAPLPLRCIQSRHVSVACQHVVATLDGGLSRLNTLQSGPTGLVSDLHEYVLHQRVTHDKPLL